MKREGTANDGHWGQDYTRTAKMRPCDVLMMGVVGVMGKGYAYVVIPWLTPGAVYDMMRVMDNSMPPTDIMRLARILYQNFYMVSRGGEDMLRNKYGLTRDTVSEVMLRQNGYCDCCGCDLEGEPWAIDHNHETGRIRGLLCYGCNTGIGKLGGTITGLDRAVIYLTKHGET